GAAFVKLALFFDERWRFAAQYPDMNVGGLFSHDWGDETGDTAEFDLDAKVGGFVADACDGEGVFAFAGDKNVNEPGLCYGRDHGEAHGRPRRIEVQQQDERKPVCDIGVEVEVVLYGFAVFLAGSDLAGGRVDQHVERMGK